jgi:hypothetical protein
VARASDTEQQQQHKKRRHFSKTLSLLWARVNRLVLRWVIFFQHFQGLQIPLTNELGPQPRRNVACSSEPFSRLASGVGELRCYIRR